MYEYTNLLISFGLTLFALIAVLRREYTLYLIILLLPTYQIRFQIFGIPATFLEGMILVLATREIIRMIMSLPGVRLGGRRSNPPTIRLLLRRLADRNNKSTFMLIILFLLAAFISIVTSPLPIKAAGIFKAYFFEAALFYFLARTIVDNEKKLKTLFKILAILVLYLSIFGIYQFITLYSLPFNWWAVNVESRRIISVLNHPNALALLLGPILAILIMLPKKTKLYWASIAFGLVALYLSFSRAAWLASLITILGLKLLSPGDGERLGERSKKIIPYALLIIIFVLAVPFSRTKILDLVHGQDLSQQNRYVLWSAAFDILKKSPITGTGLAGFHEVYKNYPLGPDRVIQNYPHNFFLNFWVETGLLGLVAIVGLLIIFYRKIYLLLKSPSPNPSPPGRGIKKDSSPLRGEDKEPAPYLIRGGGEVSQPFALAAAAGMTMIILHGLVDVSYFKNDLSVLFWLIYSLPFIEFSA